MSRMAEKYDEILTQILSEMKASELLHIPRIYEILSEEYNNEIIDRFEAEQDAPEPTAEEKHLQKIDELAASIVEPLKTTARKLYRSGAIDVEKFDPNKFILAQILLTAAMHNHKYDFAPPIKYRADLANLKHF